MMRCWGRRRIPIPGDPRTLFRTISILFFGVAGWDPSYAQSSSPITADAKLVSDYRFRGISASSRSPAIQANIDLASKAFVAGVWASSTSDYHGSHLETDWYAGATYSYGKTNLVLVGYVFIYPGSRRTTTFDVEASIVAPLGNLKTSSLVAFAPGQTNSPKSNLYLSETLAFPIERSSWLIIAHFGFETGNYDNKLDWKMAVRHEGRVVVELGLVGSNYGRRLGSDAGVGPVGSIGVRF